MFYSTPCSCKCIFIFVRIDITCIYRGGGLQRLNTQRDCVTNCALRGLAHRNFSSKVLAIRALCDAFEIVISRIVTFLKSYRNCLVSLDLRSSFEIVTPDLQMRHQKTVCALRLTRRVTSQWDIFHRKHSVQYDKFRRFYSSFHLHPTVTVLGKI